MNRNVVVRMAKKERRAMARWRTIALHAIGLGLIALLGAMAPPLRAQISRDPHIRPGTDYPHWEAFAGYSFFDARTARSGQEFDAHGGSGAIAYNLNRWLGLVGDVGGYHAGEVNGDADANGYSFLFGPQVNWRNSTRFKPFVHALFGGMNGNSDFVLGSDSQTAFAMAAGGGLDVGLTRNIAWRALQAEYFLTTFDHVSGYDPQNNVRLSTGLLFRWGRHPEMINQIPTAACSTERDAVTEGATDAVPIRVTAMDTDGDPLAYAWTTTGGRVDGTGEMARWTAAGAAPGTYSISARVDDGHGGTANCTSSVRVNPRPRRPPTVACTTQQLTVLAGGRVAVTATGTSLEGAPLTYTWRANAGQVVGNGPTVQFDSTGLAAGQYTVTVRVEDGFGAADCSTVVTVQAPPPPPQASRLGECSFPRLNISRVDNVCKRVLDDVAVRLQNEPGATVVLVGFADPQERNPAGLAGDRANNARMYLGERGIDVNRVAVRTGTGAQGLGGANRRADIVWVPAGATY